MITLFQLIIHEYTKYVFTRGFMFLLFIVPLLLVATFFVRIAADDSSPTRYFAVIDETSAYTDVIDNALANDLAEDELAAWEQYAAQYVEPTADGAWPLDYPYIPGPRSRQRQIDFHAAGLDAAITAITPYLYSDAPPFPDVRPRFVRVSLPDGIQADTTEGTLNALLPYLTGRASLGRDRALFAAVVIPANLAEANNAAIDFWTSNVLDGELRSFIGRRLTTALKNDAYATEGLAPERIDAINSIFVRTNPIKASESGGEGGNAAFAQAVLPLALAYILFILILSIGGMLLTNTVEEKSNKIVEVLLSSVSAGQLMLGKLIGLALVGFTLPAVYFGMVFLASSAFGADLMPAPVAAGLAQVRSGLIDTSLIPFFFFYFLTGYLLFASIYLAVGALSNSIQDAQSFLVPLTMLLVLPTPFLGMIVQDPNGLLARIFTFIPLYTPYAVMLRISAGPPLWEIAAATALLVITVIFILMKMGQIYRNGILSAGGAPSWRQFFRFTRKED